MRRATLYTLAFVIFLTIPSFVYGDKDVIILKRQNMLNDVVYTIASKCDCSYRVIHIDDRDEEMIRSSIKNRIVIALGDEAFKMALQTRGNNTKIIYSFVAFPYSEDNLYGVSMHPSLESKIKAISKATKIKNLGFLYSDKGIQAAKNTESIAFQNNFIPISYQFHNTKDFKQLTKTMFEHIDAFFMIPDSGIKRSHVLYIMTYARQKEIPVITWNDFFLDVGAFMSISITNSEISQKILDILKQLQSDQQPQNPLLIEVCQSPYISINDSLIDIYKSVLKESWLRQLMLDKIRLLSSSFIQH